MIYVLKYYSNVEWQNKNYVTHAVTQSLLTWLGIKNNFLCSPYILRIEMGEGGGVRSGLNSLTMISYYSELVWTMINEGVVGVKKMHSKSI